MNMELLFLFLILVLSLLLFSFLGGYTKENFKTNKKTLNSHYDSDSDSDNEDIVHNKNKTTYDNYNHYYGSFTQLTNGETFYNKKGGTIKVSMLSDGTSGLVVKLSPNDEPILFVSQPILTPKPKRKPETKPKSKKIQYYGPNGEKAKVVSNNGQQYIKVKTDKGKEIFTIENPGYSNYNNTPATYFGSTGINGANINNNNEAYGIKSVKDIINMSTPDNKKPKADYSNSLPQGIPKSQIPPGQEDLYILKSEIVPPVCPACPASSAVCPRQEPCPPCPACARCPEPSFECKKVPNYNAINNEFLPVPVLSDFSSFGM